MDRFSLGRLVAKIASFGDSFIFGSEIIDNVSGHRAWPGLIAKRLGCDYTTSAVPGCGNESIAQQIYHYFSQHDPEDTLAVINWTWCMRWDFYLQASDRWVTLGPTCVPGKLESMLTQDQAIRLIGIYRDYVGPSDQMNRFRSLQAIYAVQSWMQDRGIKSIQTYMDESLFSPALGTRLDHYRAFRDDSWPDCTEEKDLGLLPDHIKNEVEQDYQKNIMPDFVTALQDKIRPRLETFQGQTFLDWSYRHRFEVTELLHPLESAHDAAADLWEDRYRQALGI